MPRRDSLSVLSFAALVCVAGTARAADPLTVTGKIDAVTVYRGQALVTRVVELPNAIGLQDIVVTGLPERVVAGSLYAEAGTDVEIRAVSYRERPVGQDVRVEVQKLEAQIAADQDHLNANTLQKQVVAERRAYLNRLQEFVAATGNAELTKGVLNAETLKTLTAFSFDQRQALADEELKLNRDDKNTNDDLVLQHRKESELTSGATKSVREAVVFANFKNAAGGPASFRLNYLVDNAGWSPSYVARAGTAKPAAAGAPVDPHQRPVNLRYNASVQQMSGEDWGDVTMTLSTATPSMVATAPQLDPLTLVLAAGPEREDLGYAAQKSALSAQRRAGEYSRNSLGNSFGPDGSLQPQANAGTQSQTGGAVIGGGGGGGISQDAELKQVADKLQVLELVAKDAGGRREPGAPAPEQEGVSVTYKLPGRTSLPSRVEQQSIQIASLDFTGDFYKLAMPVLTSYVYDQATVTNQTKLVLLAGNVASYNDDQYVGAAALPTVAVGQQFTVGFGIDSSLRATRELVDKTDTTQGGNRVMTFKYRLSVENYGTGPVSVRLTDRLPSSKNQDVKVTVDPTNPPVTNQNVGPVTAGSTAKRAGIENWTVEVPAQAMGEKAFTLDYSYKLEFDKQLSIAGLTSK